MCTKAIKTSGSPEEPRTFSVSSEMNQDKVATGSRDHRCGKLGGRPGLIGGRSNNSIKVGPWNRLRMDAALGECRCDGPRACKATHDSGQTRAQPLGRSGAVRRFNGSELRTAWPCG